MTTLLLNLLGIKSTNKARPNRAELVKCARQYFERCQCECDKSTHTVREEVNGGTLIIEFTRAADKQR